MVGLVLTLLALGGTWYAARRGLGHGLGVLMLVGYGYGILRANFLDGFSHFMFDGAVAGLYVGWLQQRNLPRRVGLDGQALRMWMGVLLGWPFVMILLSPVLDSQHLFIQVVGLRVAILLLPLIALGARLEEEDVDRLGEWVLWLNLVAFVFALAEFTLGVERFFPKNAATEIIYASTDVGEERALRIPATFSSAHAYGGTMLLSLPVLMRRWVRRSTSKVLTVAGLVAGTLGVFLCAARSPVVQLFTILALTLLLTGSFRLLAGLVVLGLAVGAVVASNPRFQRFTTLQDTAFVSERLYGSFNEKLLDIIADHPMGQGLGSAAGTSIPFFLMEYLRPRIGLENEFSRIALEQGLLGMLLWLLFLAWLFTRLPPRRRGALLLSDWVMWATGLVFWGTAFIGTGLLSSVPGTALLLVWMGRLVGIRRPVPVQVPPVAPAAPSPLAHASVSSAS
jgi:hypothetical protein